MVCAVGIAIVDAVFPFGRFAVAFKVFMPDGLLAQRNGIGFSNFPFEYADMVRLLLCTTNLSITAFSGSGVSLGSATVDSGLLGLEYQSTPAATAKSKTAAKLIFNPLFMFQTTS